MKATDLRRLAIEGELTISTAAEHRQRLLAALPGSPGLRLDLSGVEELDTAGLQVLLLARREADRLNLTVEFGDPSRAVEAVLTLAQLDDLEA